MNFSKIERPEKRLTIHTFERQQNAAQVAVK